MSQTDDPTAQDIIQIVETTFLYNCLAIALIALPIWEYLITIDQEVGLVWGRKTRFSLQSILLVSTRICMVVSAILSAIDPESTCTELEAFNIIQGIMDSFGFIQTGLFSALRVSAIHGRNLGIFILVLSLSLTPVATNQYKTSRLTYIRDENGCTEILNTPDDLVETRAVLSTRHIWFVADVSNVLPVVLVTRIPVITADVLVLFMTWAKTYQQILHARRIGVATPLSTCLARDGTLYFLCLLLINVLEIATFRTHLGAPVNIVLASFPPILINRFMLNLRRVGDPTHSSGQDTRVLSTVRFQLSERVVGSMGEPLDHSIPESVEVEEVVNGNSQDKEEGSINGGPSTDVRSSA